MNLLSQLLCALALPAAAFAPPSRPASWTTKLGAAPVAPASTDVAWNAKAADAYSTRFCSILSTMIYSFNSISNDHFQFNNGDPVPVKELMKGGWKKFDIDMDDDGNINEDMACWEQAEECFEDFDADRLDSDMTLEFLGNTNSNQRFAVLDCPNADLTVCVFAGTNPKSIENLLTDLDNAKDPLQLGDASMKIHSGFLGNWCDAQPYVEEACHDVLEQDVKKDRKILVTGHSLGGSVATIAAAFLATKYPQRKVRMVTSRAVWKSFGAPRVGCEDFKDYVEGLPNLRLTRVINDRDLFARYPLFTGGYEHLGHLVYYNDAPNDLYPETYTFGEGTPDWMYRVPPFRMLDVGDHSMERYVKHAMTWAEAAKAGAADVE